MDNQNTKLNTMPSAPVSPGIKKSVGIKVLAWIVLIFSAFKIIMLFVNLNNVSLSFSAFSSIALVFLAAALAVLFSKNIILYKISRIVLFIWLLAPVIIAITILLGISGALHFFN